MSELNYERCSECDDCTGGAGAGDGSLYIDTPDGETIGPLCSDCYDRIEREMKDDKTIIAEAIREDRRGWPWRTCPACGSNQAGYDGKGRAIKPCMDNCELCSHTGVIPDIGPHNILRVIEWAAKNLKRWREVYKGEHGGLCVSPRSSVSNALESLLTGNFTIEIVVGSTIKIIAKAIKKETTDGENEG